MTVWMTVGGVLACRHLSPAHPPRALAGGLISGDSSAGETMRAAAPPARALCQPQPCARCDEAVEDGSGPSAGSRHTGVWHGLGQGGLQWGTSRAPPAGEGHAGQERGAPMCWSWEGAWHPHPGPPACLAAALSGGPCAPLWMVGGVGHPLWGHCREVGAVGQGKWLSPVCGAVPHSPWGLRWWAPWGRQRCGAGRRAGCPGAGSLRASRDSSPALARFPWRGHAGARSGAGPHHGCPTVPPAPRSPWQPRAAPPGC